MKIRPARYPVGNPDIALVAGWLLMGILLYTIWQDLIGIIWILAECVRFIYWLSGVGLVLLLFTELFLRIRQAKLRIANVLPVFMLLAGGAILWQLGPRYGFLVRFWLNKPGYESTVKQLQANPSTKYGEHDFYFENGFVVDTGPPLRVAFDLPGGMLNRFQAIVYDPTGFVMQIRPFRERTDRSDAELQPVNEPFGGHMYGCEPIENVWYYCHFD